MIYREAESSPFYHRETVTSCFANLSFKITNMFNPSHNSDQNCIRCSPLTTPLSEVKSHVRHQKRWNFPKILMEDQNKHVSVSLSSFWLGVVAVGVGSFLALIFSWAGATHASNSCDTNVTAHMYLPLRAAVMSCGSLHWIESIQWERQEVTLAILWQLMTAPHFYIHLLIHLWVGCVQVLEPVAIGHLTNLNKSNGNT